MKTFVKNILKISYSLFTLVVVTLVLTHCSFKRYAAESYAEAKKGAPYDVIIVPGVPYNDGAVNQIMKMRVFWAKHLYDSGYAKNIIFSGSSVYSPYIEGVIMKIMADSLGIPPEHTFAETEAEHSTENVYYSWKMAKKMGFKKIALATDPFQAGMLKNFTKEYCSEVCTIPVIFGSMSIGSKTLPNINVSSAFVKNFVPLTEREGFWERFRGTRGKRIKEEIRLERERLNEIKDTKEVDESRASIN